MAKNCIRSRAEEIIVSSFWAQFVSSCYLVPACSLTSVSSYVVGVSRSGRKRQWQSRAALAGELHETSLDGFYDVASALCVHREQDLEPRKNKRRFGGGGR